MSPDPKPAPVFAERSARDDFSADRIRWLISLRWVAMAGVLGATGFVLAGFFPGVAWPVLLVVVAGGSAYNYSLSRSSLEPRRGRQVAVSQALVDLVMLTIVLWAAGGISCPFLGFYVFHLALIGILGGPRATYVATAAAFAGAGFLAFTEWIPALKIGTWDPIPPWDTIANVTAFMMTMGAVAYVVLHAVRELRDREYALERARDQAELDRTQMVLAERRLIQAERLASLGRVAQGVAHELNTPLATIRTLAADMREAIRSLGADESLQSDLAESAALIRDETGRLGRITQALLTGGTLPSLQLDTSARLLPVVERAKALVFAGVRDGPELEVNDAVADLSVSADRDRLLQVLVNLFQNAVDANREAGRKSVWVSAKREGETVELTVEDEGNGLQPDIEGRLFEPFATTKPPGEGTGLGLYASYMLIQTMGGELTIENREQGGARACIRLPAGADTLANDAGLAHGATLS